MPIDEPKAMKEVRLWKKRLMEKYKNMTLEEQMEYEKIITERYVKEYTHKNKDIPDSQS
jgi:hypothetical protein